jgi:hypothetical protein
VGLTFQFVATLRPAFWSDTDPSRNLAGDELYPLMTIYFLVDRHPVPLNGIG